MREVSGQPAGADELGADERVIQIFDDLIGAAAVPGEAEREQHGERDAEPPAAFSLEAGFAEHTFEGSVRHSGSRGNFASLPRL